MRNVCAASLLVLLALASTAAGQGPAIDWEKEKAEILQHYRALVQVNTTYGNETKVVDYLKKVLDAEGISSKTFAKDPSRANLVARLKGNGNKRPLLILAHTDVVAVQTEKWPVDPFGAVMKDGYIWGRGTIDDKDKLVTMLMTLVATGTSGHGSVPRIDNPVVHLGAALGKIGTWETPMHLNETTRTYFERLATISPPNKAARYRALLDPQRAKQVQRYLAENEPA